MEKRSRTLPKKKRFAEDDHDSDGDDHNGVGPAKKAGKKSAFRRSNSGGTAIVPPTTAATTTTAGRMVASHPQDPLLLARGMSSRYLSAKTSHRLVPLSKTEIEKDMRHCEAYRNACLVYAQQHFVYCNRDSVRSGYFGAFIAPPPQGSGGARLFEKREKGDVDDEPTLLPDAPTSASASVVMSAPIMPIRIDPEEEKRLSLLRKMVYASEYEREELETRYLSLRAHYVYEVQLARKTRTYEMARWELLRGMVECRAKAVGLRRARMAMARDVECLLSAHASGETLLGDDDEVLANTATEGGAKTANGDSNGAKFDDTVTIRKDEKKDLVAIWNDVNTQLKVAESACMEIDTPAALSQMSTATMSDENNGARSGRSRSGSVAEETTDDNNIESTGKMNAGKFNKVGTTEPHIIPWDCMVEPQTPYEIPLLLSCLSSATDKAVGFVTDKTDPKAITWLESTLPKSTSAFKDDADALSKLRAEVRILDEELNCECERNSELQAQIIASRTRSDQMVAMMQLLRSETEAVLERHNVIMETPEVRAKSAELHKRLLEEKKLQNPSEGEEEDDEDEGEANENGELNSGDDENQDDDDDEEDKSDNDSVGIKEITVDNVIVARESEDDDEDDGSEDGEVVEGEMSEGEENEEEPRRSKRHSQTDDEEVSTSSVTPTNSSSFRKRRRF